MVMEINSLSTKLTQVTFSVCENQDARKSEMQVFDRIIDAKVFENGIYINYSRSIKWEPQALFNVNTTFDVTITFNEEVDESIIDELNENPDDFLNPVISLASNIIANISAASGNYPLITPPIFIGSNIEMDM